MASYEDTIVLNYRLVRQLGAGGFGTVYLAEHVELGRKAACKILRRELVGHGEAVERFFREAKAACAIGHRAIVDIENFGRLPDGEPFYLMEYVPGESLARRIQRAPLQLAEALAVFAPVAGALAAAHDALIIHRDIKPDNIMVCEERGRIVDVKLLDFGIAKLVARANEVNPLSQSSLTIGTPLFMSPEQARDASRVGAATDVYSFGATVFAALAGRPPFVADTIAELVLQLQVDAPPPLAQLAPHVPARLAAAVARCLEKEPGRRFPSMIAAWSEMRDAIVGAVGSGDGLAVTVQEPTETPARSRRWVAPVALAVVAAGGIAGYFAFRSPPAIEAPVVAHAAAPDAVAPEVVVLPDAAEPPDATEQVVAAPEVDAGVAHASPPRHRPTKIPVDAASAQPAPPPPDAAAPSGCDEERFRKIARQDAPSESEVRVALAGLAACKGQFSPALYQALQRELLKKL
jgi:hypothetical protein